MKKAKSSKTGCSLGPPVIAGDTATPQHHNLLPFPDPSLNNRRQQQQAQSGLRRT